MLRPWGHPSRCSGPAGGEIPGSEGLRWHPAMVPRATTPDLSDLRPSAPGDHTQQTKVDDGATIGANSTIGPGVHLGRWCMIGMGSVVTRDVPPHACCAAQPARAAVRVEVVAARQRDQRVVLHVVRLEADGAAVGLVAAARTCATGTSPPEG